MSPELSKGYLVADQFEIQFPIGSSSISQFYRVKDHKGQIFRLDLINLASLPSSFFDGNRNLYQLTLLKNVRHKNIPQFINDGKVLIENKKFAYIVHEFISGESLTDRVKRDGCLSPYTAIPILIELLETIDYLHHQSNPIIHNGISPNTIKIDYSEKRDKPFLTGFDQARTINEDSSKISFKHLSPFYSSPELMNGIFAPQSDLFSIGAVFYYMLFGIPPYFNENILNEPWNKHKALLEAARNKPLNLALADEDLIDDHVKNTLKKALAVDPEERFQSAEEFSKALKRESLLEIDNKHQSNLPKIGKVFTKKGTGFNMVAGMDELKQQLRDDVINFLDDPDLYKEYGVPMLNGLLLYGPPGCGKTFIAERFAEEVGYNFILLKPSDLQSKYINATQENIRNLFKAAEEKSPTIIFIDELDALVPTREGELNQMLASAVNELLAQMTNCGERGVLVIGATNRPEKIDPAILRTGRMDKTFFIPPPDKIARSAMFKIYLKDRPTDLEIDYDILADLTEGYVSSDLKFIIDEAARKALKTRSRITMKIFKDVLVENKPSVTIAEIKKYELQKIRWDNDRKNKENRNDRPPIGFKFRNT